MISKNFNSAREGLLAKFRVLEHLKIYNGEINTCSRVVTNLRYLFSRIVGPEDFVRFFSCSPSQIGYRKSYDSGLRANRIRIHVFFCRIRIQEKRNGSWLQARLSKKYFMIIFRRNCCLGSGIRVLKSDSYPKPLCCDIQLSLLISTVTYQTTKLK